jgi:hypothetical protein
MKTGVFTMLWFMCGAWIGDLAHEVTHGKFHDSYVRLPAEFWIGLSVNVVFIVLLYRSLMAHRDIEERALGPRDLKSVKYYGHWISLPTNSRVRIAAYLGSYFIGILVGYLAQ